MLISHQNSRDSGKSKQQTGSRINNTNNVNPWWADDDETAFTGDDDFYKKEDKRIRGGKKKKNKNKDAKTKEPKQPSKQSPELPTASDGKASTSISVSPQPIKINKNKERQSRPKLVWLMSYPNSGTSYTMSMVAKATNRATATNYGREVTDPPAANVPLYPGQLDGPFYRPDPQRPLPDDYIMVKTHCGGTSLCFLSICCLFDGLFFALCLTLFQRSSDILFCNGLHYLSLQMIGRCVKCGPEEYLLNETHFLDECRRGSGLLPERRRKMEDTDVSNLSDGFEEVHYDADLVKKAIHLMRSPFDNIVSRFHLERKHWLKRDKTTELKRYTNDARGFHVWCKDLNTDFGPTFKSGVKMPMVTSMNDPDLSIPRDVIELMQGLPCHGEFYKYVQWHNHANAVTTNYLQKPTLIVHYENYDKLWNKTATKIFDFLHLDMTGPKKDFHARHDYDPYFSPRDREAARKLIKRLARPNIWQQMERYFS